MLLPLKIRKVEVTKQRRHFKKLIIKWAFFVKHLYFKRVQIFTGGFHLVECGVGLRYRPRFFDQVGYQTMSAYIENKHFFTKPCHCQTYQNYEQPSQSLQNL